ncbi:MAG: uroporphyrinogen decarboxylase family protein [Candidatus Methanospirareceae archaeon]
MNGKERVEAAIKFESVDRTPLGYVTWGVGAKEANVTYPQYCKSSKNFADGMIKFARKYEVDLITPGTDVWFVPEGWGVKVRYVEDVEAYPMLEEVAVKEPEDYEKLEVLDPRRDGRMPVVLDGVGMVTEELRDVAVFPGLFSPLTVATHVRGMQDAMKDVILNPDLLRKGLETATETLKELAVEMIKEGADGIFMAVTRGSAELVTEQQYLDFGREYDLELIKEIKEAGGKVILHVCGYEPFLDIFSEYPAEIINYWDKSGSPGSELSYVKKKYGDKVCLATGLDQTRTLLFGTPADVEKEAKEAIEKGGNGFILCSGCEVSPATPEENLRMVTKVVKSYRG